ncbi:unnamed protein product [Rodentolepis nana]|uniref:Truncated apolipoprotein C-I n=1 Tax=Rodentolepis nana TaxID=102285 RepID=A0A0R3U0E2_RODNA|nr:unnamed protein product [Rodentolepis nana]
MKIYLPIILTVLALVAVARAEDDDDSKFSAKNLMKGVSSVRKFFNEDPTGQTMKEIALKVAELGSQVRRKIRAGLKAYVKALLAE